MIFSGSLAPRPFRLPAHDHVVIGCGNSGKCNSSSHKNGHPDTDKINMDALQNPTLLAEFPSQSITDYLRSLKKTYRIIEHTCSNLYPLLPIDKESVEEDYVNGGWQRRFPQLLREIIRSRILFGPNPETLEVPPIKKFWNS